MIVELGEGWTFVGGVIEHAHPSVTVSTTTPFVELPHRCKTCGAILPARLEFCLLIVKSESDARIAEMNRQLEEISRRLEEHVNKLLRISDERWFVGV